MSFNEVGVELEFNGLGVDGKGFVKPRSNPKCQLEN